MTPVIEAVSDPARLGQVYREILAPSFPDTEIVGREEFVAAGASGHLDVLVASSAPGGDPLGVVVGERHGDGVLVDWLAVSGTTRGGGVGAALIAAGLERWLAGGALLVLGEVERPDLFPAHPEYGDPARRLAFYERLGTTVIDLPYFQPPIADGKPRLPGLLLVVLAAADPSPAPRRLTTAEVAAVRDVLTATMGEPEADDGQTVRAFAPLDDPAGPRLLPLSRYGEVPVSDEGSLT